MMRMRRACVSLSLGFLLCDRTGERLPPLLGRSSYLTLGRGGLKHGIQGILPNQPLLANFNRGELTPLNFPSNRIGLHAQDFRRLSRGIELRFAHVYITPSLPVYYAKSGKYAVISDIAQVSIAHKRVSLPCIARRLSAMQGGTNVDVITVERVDH